VAQIWLESHLNRAVLMLAVCQPLENQMKRLWMAALIVGGVCACSGTNPEVETGPAPQTQGIPGTGSDAGSDPQLKNEDVPENASTAAKYGIPPGHLPPPGKCRVWVPGEPPGQQKKKYPAGDCDEIAGQVPPGAWLVYRPGEDKKEVVVREYGAGSQITSVRVYDIVTGALLRELDPDDGR
jgi:hypothetical protein